MSSNRAVALVARSSRLWFSYCCIPAVFTGRHAVYAHALSPTGQKCFPSFRPATAAALLFERRSTSEAFFTGTAEAVLTLLRAGQLGLLFAPVVLAAPVVFYGARAFPGLRRQWFALLVATLSRGGACWIKWGQASFAVRLLSNCYLRSFVLVGSNKSRPIPR